MPNNVCSNMLCFVRYSSCHMTCSVRSILSTYDEEEDCRYSRRNNVTDAFSPFYFGVFKSENDHMAHYILVSCSIDLYHHQPVKLHFFFLPFEFICSPTRFFFLRSLRSFHCAKRRIQIRFKVDIIKIQGKKRCQWSSYNRLKTEIIINTT